MLGTTGISVCDNPSLYDVDLKIEQEVHAYVVILGSVHTSIMVCIHKETITVMKPPLQTNLLMDNTDLL